MFLLSGVMVWGEGSCHIKQQPSGGMILVVFQCFRYFEVGF